MNKQIVKIINMLQEKNIHVNYIKLETYNNHRITVDHIFERYEGKECKEEWKTDTEKKAIDKLTLCLANYLLDQRQLEKIK